MSDFVLTEADIDINIWISTAGSAVSLVLCSAVLASAWWVHSHKTLRRLVDRVSFRLLLWSMAFEVVYDIAYIAVEFYSFYNVAGPACSSGVYFIVSTMNVVNWLCTCIAINLMLTICFGLNPIRLRLERWYVGVSIAAGMFVPLVPAALGHFGYDPILQVCWIQAEDDTTRMKHFILDLYVWQILSCVVATICVLATLVKLLRQRRRTSAALFASNELNQNILRGHRDDLAHVSQASDAPLPLAAQGSEGALRWKVDTEVGRRGKKISSAWRQLGDRFFNIALKISCYPVALIFVNLIITVGDLYFTKEGGVNSRAAYALYCIYYFLYGARGIVFAALAFFIDPCLWFAMRTAWRTRHVDNPPLPNLPLAISVVDTSEMSFTQMLSSASPPSQSQAIRTTRVPAGDSEEKLLTPGSSSGIDLSLASSISEKIGLFPEVIFKEIQLLNGVDRRDTTDDEEAARRRILAGGRKESAVSLDMPTALTRLAYEERATLAIPIPHTNAQQLDGFAIHVAPPPTAWLAAGPSMRTRSFTGVMATNLPTEITDDLDVVDVKRTTVGLPRNPEGESAPVPAGDQHFMPLSPLTRTEEIAEQSAIGPATRTGPGPDAARRGRVDAEQRRQERDLALQMFFQAKSLL